MKNDDNSSARRKTASKLNSKSTFSNVPATKQLTTTPKSNWKPVPNFKSKANNQAGDQKEDPRESAGDRLHLRRCHVCDAVSEQNGDVVSKCEGCGKFMAPFFFFNEKRVVIFTDREMRPSLPHVTQTSEERMPIRGLTAYW